jgi:hypothetical protein
MIFFRVYLNHEFFTWRVNLYLSLPFSITCRTHMQGGDVKGVPKSP